VVFPVVFFGNYTLSVNLSGYLPHTNDNLSLTQSEHSVNVNLQEALTALDERFQGATFPPAGWTLADADGDGVNWKTLPYTISGSSMVVNFWGQDGEGDYTAYSESWSDETFSSYNPNNYLITPPINVENDSYVLSWWVATKHQVYSAETYAVKVSTTGNQVADFTTTLVTETLNSSNAVWQERTLSLAQFVGQSIYIAFNHCPPSHDNFAMMIDDVLVVGAVGEEDEVMKPVVTALGANYPNPFNPSTTIVFTVGNGFIRSDRSVETPYMVSVQIDVYNIKGQKVKTLVNGNYGIGTHKIEWNGTDENRRSVGSGVYFYRMQTENYRAVRKMILMK
jgi:hypothetical protein